MNAEGFDKAITEAVDEWMNSFVAPSEAFTVKLRSSITRAKEGGVADHFIVAALEKATAKMERELGPILEKAFAVDESEA